MTYSFAWRCTYIYSALLKVSYRLHRAVPTIPSERCAFVASPKVAGGPPSFASPPTDLCTKGNAEVVPVSILSDILAPKEIFQMQLSASKILITQIIFYHPYHLHLKYTTYSLMITMPS